MFSCLFQFVAHSSCQQRMVSTWYEGIGVLERASWPKRVLLFMLFFISYPFLVLIYLFAPRAKVSVFYFFYFFFFFSFVMNRVKPSEICMFYTTTFEYSLFQCSSTSYLICLFNLFGFERYHGYWWVFCRRNARLA